MGLGGILGGIAGGILGGPAGAAVAGIGGAIDAVTGKPKKPPTMAGSDPSTMPNIDIGLDFGSGPKVKMPVLPDDIPVYRGGPLLPNNIPVTPLDMPTLPQARLFPATTGELAGMDALNAAGKLTQAQLNPNNPIFKELAAGEDQLIQSDFLRGLRDMITANQRASARTGRRGFLNPERMDEQITGATAMNAQKARAQARINAYGKLDNMISGLKSLAGGYQSQAGLETGRRDSFRQDILNRIMQQRDDINKRIEQLRSDTAARTDQRRGDIKDEYGQLRSDMATRTNQRRDDVLNALNLYRGNQATANENAMQNYRLQSDYRVRTNDNYAGAAGGFADAIGKIINQPKVSGGGKNEKS